uniref:Glycosyl hydrolase family 32 N-terminal domain-containing protein n=1 Tax=Oryza brachyantha TaxID=4533 RepID=J3MIM5_ORYBR
MVITTKVGTRGSALVYKSFDLLQWEGNTTLVHSSAIILILECPNIIPVVEHRSEDLHIS